MTHIWNWYKHKRSYFAIILHLQLHPLNQKTFSCPRVWWSGLSSLWWYVFHPPINKNTLTISTNYYWWILLCYGIHVNLVVSLWQKANARNKPMIITFYFITTISDNSVIYRMALLVGGRPVGYIKTLLRSWTRDYLEQNLSFIWCYSMVQHVLLINTTTMWTWS